MDNWMKTLKLVLTATFLVLVLAGCGDTLDGSTSGTGTDTDTDTDTDTGTPAASYSMTLVPALASLSAGGTTSVTATILADGAPYTTQFVEVSFTSACVAQGTAVMDTPVISSTGVAISTYRAEGCAITDTLVASATVEGTNLSTTANIDVQPAAMGSIKFVAATPANIGIKGVGLVESSQVQFQLADVGGGIPPAGQSVTFSLDNTMGGITFSPAQANSDTNGFVSTTVTSGTVATSVRVTAKLDSDPTIQTQSDGLVISTGISDQNSFSLSASTLNPEGWDYDGEEVMLTIRASDHYNNPVPDGSAVVFTTEGGQIDSNCVMLNGACDVTWTSQEPRPVDGRVTILATMTGEESFTDWDGDNRYDDGEPFEDLPEAWRDDDESGTYDPGEEIRDFNVNGSYTAADGKYNGVLCDGPTLCGAVKSVDVRASLVLVMAGSDLNIVIFPASFNVAGESTMNGVATICDLNNNVPPVGTTISASTTNGSVTLLGGNTVRSSNAGCYVQAFTVKGDSTSSGGQLEIKATTPNGHISYDTATVTD